MIVMIDMKARTNQLLSLVPIYAQNCQLPGNFKLI